MGIVEVIWHGSGTDHQEMVDGSMFAFQEGQSLSKGRNRATKGRSKSVLQKVGLGFRSNARGEGRGRITDRNGHRPDVARGDLVDQGGDELDGSVFDSREFFFDEFVVCNRLEKIEKDHQFLVLGLLELFDDQFIASG